jgi:hypothetical protein
MVFDNSERARVDAQQSTDAGVGSTCPVRGGGTGISAWARLRREAVAEFAAAGAEILGDDPVAARAIRVLTDG